MQSKARGLLPLAVYVPSCILSPGRPPPARCGPWRREEVEPLTPTSRLSIWSMITYNASRPLSECRLAWPPATSQGLAHGDGAGFRIHISFSSPVRARTGGLAAGPSLGGRWEKADEALLGHQLHVGNELRPGESPAARWACSGLSTGSWVEWGSQQLLCEGSL